MEVEDVEMVIDTYSRNGKYEEENKTWEGKIFHENKRYKFQYTAFRTSDNGGNSGKILTECSEELEADLLEFLEDKFHKGELNENYY